MFAITPIQLNFRQRASASDESIKEARLAIVAAGMEGRKLIRMSWLQRMVDDSVPALRAQRLIELRREADKWGVELV